MATSKRSRGLRVVRRWSPDELATLDANYPHLTTPEMAAMLGRNTTSVSKMASARGIKKTAEAGSEIKRAASLLADGSKATRFAPVHGRSVAQEGAYQSWKCMRSRCNNPNHKSYASYAGRGIRICERWNSFEAFLSDMGEPPEGQTLGRIDNDGMYEPENSRWETHKQQTRNRRSSRLLTAFGATKTLVEWAESAGIRADTISYRLRSGWAVEEALTRAAHLSNGSVRTTERQAA